MSVLRWIGFWSLLAASSASAAPAAGPFVREWNWSMLGFEIGSAAFEAVDVDADGRLELVATARTESHPTIRYWYLLEARGEGYEQVWSSSPSLDPIAGIAVVQADPGGSPEIVVAVGSVLEVRDGATRELLRSLAVDPTEPTAFGAGDVDGDGTTEAVLIDESDLYVYDLDSGALEEKKSGFGGLALDIGQADGDPALEIVVANGHLFGCVLDGATRAVEWGRNEGLGFTVRFAQLDSDPGEEVLAGWEWSDGIRAFDLPSGTELWQAEITNLAVLGAAELSGGAPDEVLYVDDQWGDLHVLAGGSGEELWHANKIHSGGSGVTAGDLDHDGVAEIFTGVGNGSSGPDLLLAFDSASHLLEWTSAELSGPFEALALADLEGDDRPELVTGGSVTWGYPGDGLVLGFDAYTETQSRRGVLVQDWGPTTGPVRAANLDQDPQDEFCAIVNTDDTGRLACFDGRSWEEQWWVQLPEGLGGDSLAIGDVDADGALEVVVGGQRLTTAAGAFVRCYRSDNGWLEWQSEDLNVSWSRFSYLRLGELDGDATLEIVALDRGDGRIVVLDGGEGAVQSGPWELEAYALEVADLDGAPNEEIYVGLATPEIARFSASNGETELQLAVEATPVAIRAVSVDGDLEAEFVYVADGHAHVREVADGTETWSSGSLGLDAGEGDALLVGDADHDTAPDIVVGTKIGFVVFATTVGEQSLFDDGFESGDTSRWGGP